MRSRARRSLEKGTNAMPRPRAGKTISAILHEAATLVGTPHPETQAPLGPFEAITVAAHPSKEAAGEAIGYYLGEIGLRYRMPTRKWSAARMESGDFELIRAVLISAARFPLFGHLLV